MHQEDLLDINLDLKLMPLTPGLDVYLAKPDELAQYIYVKSLVTYTKQIQTKQHINFPRHGIFTLVGIIFQK